jgi:UDP-GlcNAc:undecaprenyl-phosphate GlcNAc-1-phosphate transferase
MTLFPSTIWIYAGLTIVLFILMLVYFQIADRFNIIDKPNARSSHSQITIRGGGIIFYLAALSWWIWSGGGYPYFMIGLTLITLVSFIDDVKTLSNKIRFGVHLTSVALLFAEWGLYAYPWYWWFVALIVVIGTINAYNFMDGINGITSMYSFAILLLLWIANTSVSFMDERLLLLVGIANAIFAFFNFRKKAKCFAGDVGSVSMSFILLFATISLVIQQQNLLYFLFFAVYGIDSVWTILHRLARKENIFQAHRTHLYQYLANEAGGNRLLISYTYGLLQFGVGIFVFRLAALPLSTQLWGAFLILGILSSLYLVIRGYLIKKYQIKVG